MEIEFTKMHGLGNDFMVINNLQYQMEFDPDWIRQMADRRTGVGFDQLLVVEPAKTSDVDFEYRIFNADGSEVEHCGNGARCFAVFVRDKGLTTKRSFPVQTQGGIIDLIINDDSSVTIRMGIPEFFPNRVPFSAETESSSYTLRLKDEIVEIGVLAIGNPHAVTIVEDVDKVDVDRLGAQIENHERFPNRVNAGFMQILSRDAIKLRVFERGVGETNACGTGACAAVVSGIRQGHLDHNVKVSLRGGDLYIQWSGSGEHVLLTGPTATVFEGKLLL